MSNAKNTISEHSEKHFDYSQTAVCDSAHKKLKPWFGSYPVKVDSYVLNDLWMSRSDLLNVLICEFFVEHRPLSVRPRAAVATV